MIIDPPVAMLVLLEREHDRFKKPLKRLATKDVDIKELEKLQLKWQEELCFSLCASPLLAALNLLIKRRESKAYPTSAYDEVIYQVQVYKNASRTLLHQAFGSDLAPYLNEWGHLRQQYRKQYKNVEEPTRKLSIPEQADYVRSQLQVLQALLPTSSPSNAIQLPANQGSSAVQPVVDNTLLKTLYTQLTSLTQLVEEAHTPASFA